MFELTISTSTSKENYISELFENLHLEIKKLKGIAVKQNFDGRSYFSLAVPESSKEYFKSKVMDFLVYMISDDYKYNFYKEHLLTTSENLLCEPFIKAISLFDTELDTEMIKKQVDFNGEILVDSYFHFKLTPLKQRWEKTAEVINQNQILNNSTSMVEVLKYLTAVSENLTYSADVSIGQKQIKLQSKSKTSLFSKNFQGQSSFLVKLISENPVKINLKLSGKTKEDPIFKVINDIYSDKIYFVN